ARILQMQDARKRAQQGGFAESRHAFQQNVSPSEQADENDVHYFLLANNYFPDFLAHPIQLLGGELKRCVRLHALYDSAGSAKRPSANSCMPPADTLRPCDFDFFRSSRGGLLT